MVLKNAAQTSLLVACALSRMLLAAVQLGQRAFHMSFSCTEKVITLCSIDLSIRSNSKGLIPEELDGVETDYFFL